MSQASTAASSGTTLTPPNLAGSRKLPLTLGLGCLSVLVLGCLFVAGVMVVANTMMRSTDAYRLALEAAQREPSVTAELGRPVRAGWLTTGHFEVRGPSGEANLEIPLSGPRGSGTLHVRASKSAGKWSFSKLNVRVSGRHAPLDLLAASSP